MPEFPRSDFRLHVGWRNIKTSVTAMLVAMVYCLIGRNPAFACIGVIFGMGVDMRDSIQNGGNRLFGTLIGGLLSIGVFWVYLLFYPQGGHTVFLAVLLGAGGPSFWRSATPLVNLWEQMLLNAVLGAAVLGLCLALSGRDGKLATYALLVLAMGSCQWLLLRGWKA